MSTLTPTPTTTPTRDRPVRRPGRRRRYPAGRAIAVVLLTLFIAALLDADSLVASVSSERYGAARSIELSLVRPFRAVSDALWLNRPHQWLADIAGTNRHLPALPGSVSPTEESAISAVLGGGLAGVNARNHTAPSHGTRALWPRTPTAADPVRVWLAGDSLMGMVADAFLSHAAGNPAITAASDVQIGTGLARPDVYDWPGQIALEMQQHPDVVVLTFGLNDDQDMTAGGQYLTRGSPGWRAEYARRVAQVMSEVTSSGALLVWLQIPPVQRPQLQSNDAIVNAIVGQQARSHPGVLLVNPTPAVAPNGVFAEYLPGAGGQPIEVRDSDGVHLTPAGAGRVLPLVIAAIRTRWRIN